MDVDLKENGVKVTRWMLNHTPPPTYRKAAPNLAEKVDRWGIFDFTAPGVVVQWSGALDAGTGAYDKGKREGGYSVRALHGLTPETETSCHYFWCISQTHRKDDMQATRLLFDESETAFREDQVMVESQQKNLSEFGEKSLINVASDRARVHMRRIVEKIIAAEARPS